MNEGSDTIDAARNAVSKFCFTCEESCCRRGKLNMTVLEASVMPKKLLVQEWDESVSLSLENGCPKLKNNQCSIYENRPSACRKYPFYQFAKRVFLAPCPAIKQGLVDEEIKAIRTAGFLIEE